MDYIFGFAIAIGVVVMIMVIMGVIALTTLRKTDKQVDDMVLAITSSFTSITQDITVITTRLEDYERSMQRETDLQHEIITSALKNITDRVERLDRTTQSMLNRMDQDINKLYSNCSRKIERESE